MPIAGKGKNEMALFEVPTNLYYATRAKFPEASHHHLISARAEHALNLSGFISRVVIEWKENLFHITVAEMGKLKLADRKSVV